MKNKATRLILDDRSRVVEPSINERRASSNASSIYVDPRSIHAGPKPSGISSSPPPALHETLSAPVARPQDCQLAGKKKDLLFSPQWSSDNTIPQCNFLILLQASPWSMDLHPYMHAKILHACQDFSCITPSTHRNCSPTII